MSICRIFRLLADSGIIGICRRLRRFLKVGTAWLSINSFGNISVEYLRLVAKIDLGIALFSRYIKILDFKRNSYSLNLIKKVGLDSHQNLAIVEVQIPGKYKGCDIVKHYLAYHEYRLQVCHISGTSMCTDIYDLTYHFVGFASG